MLVFATVLVTVMVSPAFAVDGATTEVIERSGAMMVISLVALD